MREIMLDNVYLVYDTDEDGYRYVDSVFSNQSDAESRSLVLHGNTSEYEDMGVL